MPGAIVPSDWDGSTYDCLQIKWPSSEQWKAFLLGQMTELVSTNYWDATVSSEAEIEAAVLAVETAYRETIENFPLECESMQTTRAFAAVPVSQVVQPNAWKPLEFVDPEYIIGNPGFEYSLGGGGHRPYNGGPDAAGLWTYKAVIWVTQPTPIRIHLASGLNGTVHTERGFYFTEGKQCVISHWSTYWTGNSDIMNLMMFSTTNFVNIDQTRSRWYGQQVSPYNG